MSSVVQRIIFHSASTEPPQMTRRSRPKCSAEFAVNCLLRQLIKTFASCQSATLPNQVVMV
ncbi:unnamed protein product [Cylicocyclus nassatus]|uniref:Uncharacterized protein n=1 Tax=Cylicocyclus nassatus TaxID=53992 RepID=A0AA36GUS2_CYLNA|nr:unnamed protein product [Cylicocyclus nassatus]